MKTHLEDSHYLLSLCVLPTLDHVTRRCLIQGPTSELEPLADCGAPPCSSPTHSGLESDSRPQRRCFTFLQQAASTRSTSVMEICTAGQWEWNGIPFEAFHPSKRVDVGAFLRLNGSGVPQLCHANVKSLHLWLSAKNPQRRNEPDDLSAT